MGKISVNRVDPSFPRLSARWGSHFPDRNDHSSLWYSPRWKARICWNSRGATAILVKDQYRPKLLDMEGVSSCSQQFGHSGELERK